MLTKDSLKSIPESAFNELSKRLDFENELEKKHFQMIERLISKYTFKVLLDKLISKHDKSYEDRCYKKGYMPYPNNLLNALLSYVETNGELMPDGSVIDVEFFTETYSYEDFYFIWMYGQGLIIFIYNKDKERIFQI